MPDHPLLELRAVSKVYGGGFLKKREGVVALDGLSFSLGDERPTITAIAGESGSGKSTLMRTVATLQTPTEGAVRFGDIDVIAEPEKLRRTLGYLPQSFGFHPKAKAERLLEHFAVLEGIVEPGVRRDVVESLLRRTNLWEVRRQALGTFSGGMRQRVMIAMAISLSPKLIVADEPTTALDATVQAQIIDLLLRLQQESHTALMMITHDLGVVADIADERDRPVAHFSDAFIQVGRELPLDQVRVKINATTPEGRWQQWEQKTLLDELHGIRRLIARQAMDATPDLPGDDAVARLLDDRTQQVERVWSLLAAISADQAADMARVSVTMSALRAALD